MIFRIVLVLLFTGIASTANAQVKDVEHMLAEDWQLEYRMKVYAIIVDTRIKKEFRKDRIEGAIGVPDMDNLIPFADSLDRETPLFIYCDGESRSSTVVAWLIENEFTEIYLLKGGYNEWKALGMPVDKTRLRKRRKRLK